MRVRVSTNLRGAATCCGLATLVTSARVLMPLMGGAGAMMLVRGAGRSSATRQCSGTQTDAVHQQRECSNDDNIDTPPHRDQ